MIDCLSVAVAGIETVPIVITLVIGSLYHVLTYVTVTERSGI